MLSISRKVRVGVIGAGRIGRIHLENLAHKVIKVELAAVSEIAFAEAEKCAKEHAIPVVQQAVRCEQRQGRGNRMIELEYQGSRPRLQSGKVFGIGVSRRSPVSGMNHRCSVCAIEYGDDDSYISLHPLRTQHAASTFRALGAMLRGGGKQRGGFRKKGGDDLLDLERISDH